MGRDGEPMSDHREAVRSNAKYLSNVRPIDPEEICEYIDGHPHPAVVRQILREEALDLGLLEREGGTFVPVSDEPVTPRSGPIEALPERYELALEELLVERYGPTWFDRASGDLLRSVIRRFKAQYLHKQHVEYDKDVAAGYALYHLPAYYAAIQYVLDDLTERSHVDRSLRILDVGAGVGGPALGLCDYLEDGLLEYHAVEPSAAADVLETLLAETGPNVHPTVHRTPIEAFDAESPYDLILACNVLSELEEPVAVVRTLLSQLAADGSLVAMAPADKETSIGLRAIERAVEDESVGDDREVTVYGPTVRLWPGKRPTDRGWSFDVRPDLEVPRFQRQLEDAAGGEEYTPGEFLNVDVQYSYSILRVDGRRRIELELDQSTWATMAEMDRHVTNRIDLVAAKLSHSLSEGASNPLFKISDGSEAVDHYAVVTNQTELNRPLMQAGYGDLCSFESALVLWNDDKQAYNLVIDEQTIVDRVA